MAFAVDSARTSADPRRRRRTRPDRAAFSGTPGSSGPALQDTRRGRRPAVRRSPAPSASSGAALESALDDAAARSVESPTSFAAAGVPAPLVDALARAGVHAPFAIQARTLPDALAGRDILGRAQTGSGKTLGFGLPVLARVAGADLRRTPRRPHGLVVVPTRELAQQVTDVLTPLGRAVGLRVLAVYGGASMRQQIAALREGTDIVVATPGRLLDLISQGACDLGEIAVSVLDEADHLADLGFLPDVRRLLDQTPGGGQRMLFSATLDRGVDRLVQAYLNEPALHAVAAAAAPVGSVDHRVLTVHSTDKVRVAAEIAGRPARTLVFVRTKHGADRLARQMRQSGVEAATIHGNRSQSQRARALQSFTDGAPRVLIATDIAARGIHVDDVDLVVHFDPPADHKDYLHRSGRTARAGAVGTVVSLVQDEQRRDLAALHLRARVEPTVVRVVPGDATVRELAESGEPLPAVVRSVPRESRQEGSPRSRGRRRGVRPHRPRTS